MKVLGVLEENKNGRSAYSWVERKKDGYHLFNVEEHYCGGPYTALTDALANDGRSYGDEYMMIEHKLTRPEFEKFIQELDFSNVWRINLNGVQIDEPTYGDLLAVDELSRVLGLAPPR